jgi:protease YdgD
MAATPSNSTLQQIDVSTYPWSAIGKLNNSVGGSCTGAAIGQDEVLTAAHCIFNERTGKFLPPSALHILFGYLRGDYKVHALVERYQLGPGYDPARESKTIASDWAVLKLTQPLPTDMKPLPVTDQVPAAGTALMIAGYGQRRLQIMTGDEDCKLIGAADLGTVLVHDCKVARGVSGAPLLAIEDGTPMVIGLQVATGTRNGAAVGLAIPMAKIKTTSP